MELFLNLCWLALLVPAALLWQRCRATRPQSRWASHRGVRPLTFFCALGCAFVLLFPVISASDDLHAMRPEMEDSESSFRNAQRGGSTTPALSHSAHASTNLFVLVPQLEQVGTTQPFSARILHSLSRPAPAGRAPPSAS